MPFIIATLAVWEIVEIWHHSALLSRWRARVELWEGWAGQLLRCPFCLAPWVALAAVIVLDPAVQTGWPMKAVSYLLHAFAVARCANLGNDLCHAFCRTPRHDSWSEATLPASDSAATAEDATL